MLGAHLLLSSSLDLAERFDLAEGFVGVTLVALGTSLPELVTVVQSARRDEADLIVGNLFGSNLFNSLAVTGMVGLLGSSTMDSPQLSSTGPVAGVVISALAVTAMQTGHCVTRKEGALFVASYGVILVVL